jgi:hypothetical protein
MDAAMVKALADLIGAVAWPIVTGVTLYGFRSEFRKIIANLRLLKWGDKEAKFEEAWRADAVKVSAAIDNAVKQQPALRNSRPEERSLSYEAELELLQEEGIRNSATVMTEWKNLEMAMAELAKAHGINNIRRIGPALDTFDRKGIIPKSLLEGIRELYRLRNDVAHKPTFEPDERSTGVYIASAREALTVLKQLTSTARASSP